MAFIIGLLTLVMVLDCLIVILLVLIQLPKKDAGAGLAFVCLFEEQQQGHGEHEEG